MRLNFLLVVVIIAALIASGFFILNYFKKSTALEELEEKIDVSKIQIQELTLSSETLTEEIDDLKVDQTTLQNAIIEENSSITVITNPNEVIRDIMELSLKHGISIIPLGNLGWTDVQISQNEYRVLNLNFTVESSELSIINFVRGLQDLYPTLVIESLSIGTLVATQTSDAEIPDGANTDGIIQSKINIAIYSR